MLSRLLADGVLFCNSREFVCPRLKEAKEETIVLFININDCFCPAADAECLTLTELPTLFSLYEDKEFFGVVEFVALKRGLQPVKRLKSKMIIEEVWTPKLDSLSPNSL